MAAKFIAIRTTPDEMVVLIKAARRVSPDNLEMITRQLVSLQHSRLRFSGVTG